MTSPLYAFIHIPKCAGTTLSSALETVYGKRFLHIQDAVITAGHFENISLDKLDVILGHFPYQLVNRFAGAREVKYICFFREPFQRLLSYYTFILSDPKNSKHAWASEMNFYSWVESQKLAGLDNDMVRFMAGRTQVNYDAPGEPVDLINLYDAIDNLGRLAYIGLQEDFDRAMIGLADFMGWGSFPKYQSKRVQEKRRLVKDLPEITMELLEKTQLFDKRLYQEVQKLYICQGE